MHEYELCSYEYKQAIMARGYIFSTTNLKLRPKFIEKSHKLSEGAKLGAFSSVFMVT